MGKVMIVTDSTAYIPRELLNGQPIMSVPLKVIWGNEILRDGIDILPDEFYQRLSSAKELPSTSQVTPEEFTTIYGSLLEKGYDILSIHISGKLSGTLDSATQARKSFPEGRIELLDSKSTSMAMGFQVLSAAHVGATGATLKECKAVAEKAVRQSGIDFVVNTLEYLHRGGRIGGAQAFMGTMLNMKPVLEIQDGRIEPVDRVRTFTKALDRLLEIVENKITQQDGPIRLAVVHANALPAAESLLDRIVKRFPTSLVTDAVISAISPVIGTHVGPGALGIAYMYGM